MAALMDGVMGTLMCHVMVTLMDSGRVRGGNERADAECVRARPPATFPYPGSTHSAGSAPPAPPWLCQRWLCRTLALFLRQLGPQQALPDARLARALTSRGGPYRGDPHRGGGVAWRGGLAYSPEARSSLSPAV